MVSHTVLLTDIIELGDINKKDLYRKKNTTAAVVDEDALKRQISIAINNAMPEIKNKLQRELFAALSAK